MNKSLIAVTLLLGLSTGVAVAAPPSEILPTSQVAEQPQGTAAENEALRAYKQNINPEVLMPTTSPYDLRDRYTAPNGYELPGYGSLPPA